MLNTKQLEKDLVGFSKYGIELSNGMVMNFSKLDTVYKEKHKVTLDKWQNIKCFVQVTSKNSGNYEATLFGTNGYIFTAVVTIR
jgi:hypothetical protein